MDTSVVDNDLQYLYSLALGAWKTRIIISALELDIFTKISGRKLTCDEMQSEFKLLIQQPQDFLDALVALKFLHRDESGQYSNTDMSEKFLNATKKEEFYGTTLKFMAKTESIQYGKLTKILTEGVDPQWKSMSYDGIYKDRDSVDFFS